MLKLKLQYFGHLMWKVDSLEKTLMLGGIGGRRRRGRQRIDGWMTSLTQWTWVWVNSGSWWWTGRPCVLRFMGLQRVGHDWATDLIWQNNKWRSTQWSNLRQKPRQRYTAGEKGYAVSPLPQGWEISDLFIFNSTGFRPSLSLPCCCYLLVSTEDNAQFLLLFSSQSGNRSLIVNI